MKTSTNFKTTIAGLMILFFSQGAYSQTIINGSFTYGGIMRTYRLYIPAMYNPATAVPLVFNLHGYGSNNTQQEVYGDFRPIADTAGFIIAHPNGTVDGNGNRFWNTFDNSSVDDLGFLSALIDTISAGYNIDSNRIYSTGMSNGGFMSHDLACFLSPRITAIASVTGSMMWSRLATCNPQHPMPVMQIHGTADATVPYNGNAFFVHIDTLVKYWVNFNNCLPNPQIIQIPDIAPNDGCTAEQHIFGEGDQESSVELFKVLGGGHSWPGAPFNINITNMDFSASVEIWRFFRQFSLDNLTSIQTEQPDQPSFMIYPNPSRGLIHLKFDNDLPKTIVITNSLGQQVGQYTCTAAGFEVFLPAKGSYQIFVLSENRHTWVNKLIIY
ncbi:MAG: hypothetical protein IH598_00235 [Bacteroidales bacterium]|nr:hypothetical protein [Bacteroidales bacterium]